MRDVLQDLRYAARSLRRSPAFTAAAVITLALGIGANSAIFTLLDAVMLKPLALPNADELVTLYENPTGRGAPSGTPDTTGGTGRFLRFSYPRYLRLQRALGPLGSLAAMTRTASFVVRLENNARQTLLRGQLVSGNYFATAGVRMARGRSFTDDDAARAATQPVAVISDGYWKRALGASDAALGRSVLVGRLPVTVIGVAPPGFVGAWSDNEADIWMPATMQATLDYQNNNSAYGPADRNQPWLDQDGIAWLNLVARVPRGSLPQAEAVLRSTNRDALVDLSLTLPDPRARASITSGVLVVEPFTRGFSGLRDRFSTPLMMLSAMVAIVLLVACANVANLLLARSTARAREIGIRVSLGASRARLIQQGLTESLLLAGIGGLAGVAIGERASTLIARAFLGSFNSPLPLAFATDLRVLVFTAATTLLTAVIFGLMPSIRATRLDVLHGLSLAGGRGVVSGSMLRGMRSLVAAQLALSFVVVFAAGLLGRSLLNFSRVDPGFSINPLVAIAFAPRISGYPVEQLPALRERLLTIARGVPGVTSVAISSCGLMANCTQSGGFHLGPPTTPARQLNVNYVGAGFFTTVGVPLIAGREFSERDAKGSPLVAMVSESVARRYPGGVALGQPVGDDEFSAEIVGVVRDTRPLTLRDAPLPMIYFPIAQTSQSFLTVTTRVAGDGRTMATAIGQAFKAAEPALIGDTARAMDAYLAQATNRERVVTYLLSSLGALALLLGCVGLYGVLSYAVARRTPELGLRVALGARPSDLRQIVLRDALHVTVGGVLAGLAAAYWANRLLQSLVFDVGLFDPITCAAVITLLALSAFAACSVPAIRASRVDPIQALRAE
jgi:putative ABC transport system permease protein